MSGEELDEEFGLEERPELVRRYNVAPTQEVPVVTNRHPKRLELFRWGLVPHWAKDPRIGNRMINARVESLADKPSFRNAFQRRRCLVLADGYYEWKRTPAGKQPMYVHLASGRPFGFAGLWEVWRTPDGTRLLSCAIVTAPARGAIAEVHARMPVIVPPELRGAWLDPDPRTADALGPLLERTPERDLEIYPVSTLVNAPANDLPACIEPVGP